MKAAVVHSFDQPPQYAEFDDPTPKAGELMVKVIAAGLHPIVKGLASGKHYGSKGNFPFVAGIDGVGTLDDGSRVYFGATCPPYGTFAERSMTTREMCLGIPDGLDAATVAAMMNPAMSSWAALSERAHFQAGENVLIQGATGTAGRLAVQICKRRGASRIVATGRNQKALEELRAFGADAVIPLTQDRADLVSALRDAIAEHEIDIILDYLWGAPAEALLEAITQKGLDHAARRIRYIQIGSAAGPNITLPGAALRSSGLEILGSGFGSASMEKLFAALAAFLKEAAKKPFAMDTQPAPLSEVETLWTSKTGARLVFQP